MRAIILAAGEGARLRPLTNTLPKPMIPVANQPILAYAVEALAANGITDLTFVVGYRREKIQSYFQDGARFGVKIRYAFQDLLLGTAHALARAEAGQEDALVMGGDNVIDPRLVRDLLAARGPLRMAVHRSKNPSKYGVIVLDKGRVSRIEEKPRDYPSEMVNTGVYYITPSFRPLLQERLERGIGGLSLVLQDLLETGTEITAVQTEGLWMDAVYPWQLLELNDVLVRRGLRDGSAPGGVRRGAGVTTRSTTSVVGPAVLGEGSLLESGVAVGPTSSIGRNCYLGANSVVENSILMDDVRIGAGSIVRNCVLAQGVVVGPRFTALSGPCDFRAEDGWHPLEDFGCVVGNDARLGGNVTVEAGITIGARSNVASGAWVRRPVPDAGIVQG